MPEYLATPGPPPVNPEPDLPAPGEAKRGAQGRLGYLLRQAQVTMRNAFDRALEEVGLTLPQFSVLSLTAAYDRPSAADLARVSMLSPQTVNLVVRKLEERGLIDRTADPVHGRILRLDLTESGQAVLAEARQVTRAMEREMVEGLAPGEEAVIREWLVSLATRFAAP